VGVKWLDDMKKKAQDEAGKLAAKAVIDQAQHRVEAMAEGLLSSGEEALQARSSEVEEKKLAMGLPETDASNPDWADGLDEASAAAYKRAKQGEQMPEGPTDAEKRSSALAELARLKGGGFDMLADAQAALERAAAQREAAEDRPAPTLVDDEEYDDEPSDGAPQAEEDPFADVGDVLARAAATRASTADERPINYGTTTPEFAQSQFAATEIPELPAIDDDPLGSIEQVLARAAAARGVTLQPLQLGPTEVELTAAVADHVAIAERLAVPRQPIDPFAAAEALLARSAAARGVTTTIAPIPRATPDDPFSAAQAALDRAAAARRQSQPLSYASASQPERTPKTPVELPKRTVPDLLPAGIPSQRDPFAAAEAALLRAADARKEAKHGKGASVREARAKMQLAQLKRARNKAPEPSPSQADTDPGEDDIDVVPKRRL
jgi:hypothetical protein